MVELILLLSNVCVRFHDTVMPLIYFGGEMIENGIHAYMYKHADDWNQCDYYNTTEDLYIL